LGRGIAGGDGGCAGCCWRWGGFDRRTGTGLNWDAEGAYGMVILLIRRSSRARYGGQTNTRVW
jgi:hypothetical protein